MTLRAESRNCFASQFVLKYHDRPCGEFNGRWFGESIEVRTTSHQRLVFQKQAMLSSHFQLIDADQGHVYADAQHAGLFTRTWQVQLTYGHAELQPSALLSSRYQLVESEQLLAELERLGACSLGWMARDRTAGMPFTDLLAVGLVYQVILSRQRRSSGAAAGGGGGA